MYIFKYRIKYMSIESFVKSYNKEKIFVLENQDPQYQSLQKAWNEISQKFPYKQKENIFFHLVLQNSLISYQIAWSGYLRWEEFSQKIIKDFSIIYDKIIKKESLIQWWYDFLTTSKYNKRLYNIKNKRLQKLEENNISDITKIYQNQYTFLQEICSIYKSKEYSKIPCFTIKMLVYASRIIYQKDIQFSDKISIPLDSRLKKIYELNFGRLNSEKIMLEYFNNLAWENWLSPLQLDSILWLDYRHKYIKS